MKSIFLNFVTLALLTLTSSSCIITQVNEVKSIDKKTTINLYEKPKNIILLIGDGMGLSEVSASLYYNNGNVSNFERFSTIGLIKTSASDNLITDSAAGATAFAAGIKTYNGAIGVDTDTTAVETIVEQLEKRKKATGIIATSSIVHATPASFFAHSKSRRLYEEIATFLPSSGLDFIAGGGLEFLNKRKDDKDILQELIVKGYQVNTSSLPEISTEINSGIIGKQAYILADNGMPKMVEGRGDFLPQATRLALQSLTTNKEGFFLMVEGSQIDWGGHANDAEYLISELLDFDKAIGVALDFAAENGETLVIVTADHETGGFTLAADERDYNTIKPTFSTGGHSATMVPVFAEGPGAFLFSGLYENTEIYHKMMALFSEE